MRTGRGIIGPKGRMTNEEKNRIFSAIASNSGLSLDVDCAKKVYYALIRVIMKEIREKGYIQLPDFGIYYLIEHKGLSVRKCRQNGGTIEAKNIRMLKWRNSNKLKEYMRNMEAKVIF